MKCIVIYVAMFCQEMVDCEQTRLADDTAIYPTHVFYDQAHFIS